MGRDRLQDIHVKGGGKREMTAFSIILSMEEVEKGKDKNRRLPAKDGSKSSFAFIYPTKKTLINYHTCVNSLNQKS